MKFTSGTIDAITGESTSALSHIFALIEVIPTAHRTSQTAQQSRDGTLWSQTQQCGDKPQVALRGRMLQARRNGFMLENALSSPARLQLRDGGLSQYVDCAVRRSAGWFPFAAMRENYCQRIDTTRPSRGFPHGSLFNRLLCPHTRRTC